jgi:arsenite methyltransferase
MKNPKDIKEIVKEKYGKIVSQSKPNCGCGCDCDESAEVDYSVIGDSYDQLEGYVAEADLGLGCGLPTEHADIQAGDTAVDLGSGAGNDVFITRRIVGESGKVIGIDMTEEMIKKAIENNLKLGYTNVEFRLGEIEKMPVPDNEADVVISNCVLNLVPSKEKAFSEIYRILKPGGHFCISDIVTVGQLPEKIRESVELYVGCVAGALEKEEYLSIIRNAGFSDIQIQKSKVIEVPQEDLRKLLTEEEISDLKANGPQILSITVSGFKS